MGRKYLQIRYPVKDFCPEYMNNCLNSTIKTKENKNIDFLKMSNLSGHLTKEGIQMVNKYKRFSASSVIRTVQTKTSRRYYDIPITMAKILNSAVSRADVDSRATKTLRHCWWECKKLQPFWEKVWKYLRTIMVRRARSLIVREGREVTNKQNVMLWRTHVCCVAVGGLRVNPWLGTYVHRWIEKEINNRFVCMHELHR